MASSTASSFASFFWLRASNSSLQKPRNAVRLSIIHASCRQKHLEQESIAFSFCCSVVKALQKPPDSSRASPRASHGCCQHSTVLHSHTGHTQLLSPTVEEAAMPFLGCSGCFNIKIKFITDVSQGAESEGDSGLKDQSSERSNMLFPQHTAKEIYHLRRKNNKCAMQHVLTQQSSAIPFPVQTGTTIFTVCLSHERGRTSLLTVCL